MVLTKLLFFQSDLFKKRTFYIIKNCSRVIFVKNVALSNIMRKKTNDHTD